MSSGRKKKVILISNDDGISSDGLKALVTALKRVGRVYVVAPDRERSAASHSLTLHRPLRVEQVAPGFYSVDGTPTDCVSLAVNGIIPERPDMVVSGINRGANLGEDISYSGTVSAAMEGALLGIPSIAVSLELGTKDCNFKPAASFAARLARRVLAGGLPEDTLLNVNVPCKKTIKGCRVTRQGKRVYADVVTEKIDPRGKKYYWIGGDIIEWKAGRETDYYAITRGYISITPVHLDMTNYSSIDELKGWKF